MRTIFVILLCLLLSGMVFSQKPIKKTESEIDSLSFSYDVRDMTILVNDTLVDYSVVFDPETGTRRGGYTMVRGALSHYEAIKLFGEKYSCLLYTSPSPRDKRQSRMPSSA